MLETTTLTIRRVVENVGKTRASKRLETQIAESGRTRGAGLVRPEEVQSNEVDRLKAELHEARLTIAELLASTDYRVIRLERELERLRERNEDLEHGLEAVIEWASAALSADTQKKPELPDPDEVGYA